METQIHVLILTPKFAQSKGCLCMWHMGETPTISLMNLLDCDNMKFSLIDV